jgi:hypothetical protein
MRRDLLADAMHGKLLELFLPKPHPLRSRGQSFLRQRQPLERRQHIVRHHA